MFKVGERFYTYKQFELKLKEYEVSVLNKYWVRDSLTLKTQARRFPESQAAYANSKLKYSHVRIACILGGREQALLGTRRQSIRQGCQAGMLIRLSKCGQYLELISINEVHNHFHSDHLLNFVEDVKTEPTKYSVTFEDLLQLGVKPDMKNEFYECVEILKNVHNCDVNILCDELENVLCLFLQNREMKLTFDAFPEVIFVEGTNNLHETGATYLIMVEDSEGNGAVVAVGIMLQVDMDVIEWFIMQFEESNPNSEEVKVIMSDRKCIVSSALSAKFSDAVLQTPLFHTLKYFKTEVNPQFLNITNRECECARKFLKNLASAVSEEAYEDELAKMKAWAPKSVMRYYEQNWHPIQDQWVLYRTINYRLLLNQSRNKVENIRHKFKSVIVKFFNVEEFIKMFFICINSIKVTFDANKFNSDPNPSNIPEEIYRQYLTNYAYDKVSTEFKLMNECSNFQIVEIDRCFAPTLEGMLEVRYNSCQCLFWTSMQLPCRHIFKFRSISYLSLFEQDLCDERWSQNYLFTLHSSFNTEPTKLTERDEDVHDSKEGVLSKEEKIEMVNAVGNTLAKMSSGVPGNIYSKRMKFIKRLSKEWSNDGVKEVFFEVCDDETNEEVSEHLDRSKSYDNVNNRKIRKVDTK